MEIDVAGIIGESIVDGPGIRLTVFCQGCPHHLPRLPEPRRQGLHCEWKTEQEEKKDGN